MSKDESSVESGESSKRSTENANLLFLCTKNSCRSQIAEAWARALSCDEVSVESAGLVKRGISPFAITVMREVDIDLNQQKSSMVTVDDYAKADIIITVCEQADRRCPPLPAGKIKYHWPIKDPSAQRDASGKVSLDVFRQCRDEIRERVISLFQIEGLAYGADASEYELSQI